MKASYTLEILIWLAGTLRIKSELSESSTHISVKNADADSVKLLYGESHGISWTDHAKIQRQPPLLDRKYFDVYGVDYHYKQQTIFYTGGNAIWRMPMEAGSKNHEILVDDVKASTLAVDWEHDLIYWTRPAARSVLRTDLDDEELRHDVIIEDAGNMTKHSNVAVDPYMRYLFVATESGYALRSDLEGDYQVALDHGLLLTSLALDIHNRRLWVTGYRDFAPRLQSSDYDGGLIIRYELNHGSDSWVSLKSIDVFSAEEDQLPQLFWVHHGWRERDTAWSVQITDGNQLSWRKEYTARGTILDPETRIWCVKVLHEDVQRKPKYLTEGKCEPSSTSEAFTVVASKASFSALENVCQLPPLCIILMYFFGKFSI